MTASRPPSFLYWLLAALLVVTLAGLMLLWLAPRAQESPEVLFRLGGQPYGSTDLPREYQLALAQTQRHAYLAQRTLLEGAAVDAYISRQSDSLSQSRASLEAHLFDPTPPTSAAVAAFYQANRERIGTDLAEAREAIIFYLLSRRRQQEQRELVTKLMHLGELEINLPPPPNPPPPEP